MRGVGGAGGRAPGLGGGGCAYVEVVCPDTGRVRSPRAAPGLPAAPRGAGSGRDARTWVSAGLPGAGRASRAAASARGRGGSARLNGLLVRAAHGRPRSLAEESLRGL